MNDEDDLDAILADQYHCAKRRLKVVARLRKVVNFHPHEAERLEKQIHLSMQFFENMIIDKRLLKKKHKRKKQTDDILNKLDTRAVMKNAFTMYAVSYRMITHYWQSYMSFWNLDRGDKNVK